MEAQEIERKHKGAKSSEQRLDQMTDPTLPDTVNDAMASLSAMSKALAQATDSSIPESLTAAADTLQYRLEKLPPMDYTGIMTDVVNTTESFYSNCFGKERLAEIFSMVKLFGDSPEVKGLQAMLDAYGRDGVINQEGVHAYINDFGRYWEHAAKAKDRDESAVPAQNLTIIKLISNPKKEDLPKGSKSVFEELSKSAAANLAQSNDVLFDVKSKEFYRRETPDQKISPKRVSMAVSAQQVFEDISQDALIAFESKLFENASFACQDPVGKMIHDRIEAWTDRVDLEQDVYYHARRIEDGCDYYNDDEMMKVPTNVTSQGRYNDIGRSYYYIADTKEGAIKEITKHCGSKKPRVQVVGLHPTQHVETVVLLSHKKADSYIHIDVEFGEGEGKIPVDSIAKRAEAYKPKEKVTYKMIKEYIEAKYGFKVHTAYIAEVKRNLGLPMYDAPNAVEELKQPRKHPTPEKVEAIKDALRYFAVI